MLSKKNRISRKGFPTPSLRGFRLYSPLFSIVVYTTGTNPRVAIVVSKKIAKIAVQRNKIRRRMYDALQPYLSRLAAPVTIVVYPTQISTKASFGEIQQEVNKTLLGSKFLNK